MAKTANLHDVAVDAGAVGAFQVGQDDVVAVLLDLGVETADPFVVEAQPVALFAADRDRRRQVPEDAAFVDALKDLERNLGHSDSPPDPSSEAEEEILRHSPGYSTRGRDDYTVIVAFPSVHVNSSVAGMQPGK